MTTLQRFFDLFNEPTVRYAAAGVLLLGWTWVVGWLAVRRYVSKIKVQWLRVISEPRPAQVEPAQVDWVAHPKAYERLCAMRGDAKSASPGAQSLADRRLYYGSPPNVNCVAAPDDDCAACAKTPNPHQRISAAYGAFIDTVGLCKDAECSECARIVCYHKDPLHFHHDGCPSCDGPTAGKISWVRDPRHDVLYLPGPAPANTSGAVERAENEDHWNREVRKRDDRIAELNREVLKLRTELNLETLGRSIDQRELWILRAWQASLPLALRNLLAQPFEVEGVVSEQNHSEGTLIVTMKLRRK